MNRLTTLRYRKIGKRHGSRILDLVDRLASCSNLQFLGFEEEVGLTPWAIIRPSIQIGMPFVAGIGSSEPERLLDGLKALVDWLGSEAELLYADCMALPWARLRVPASPEWIAGIYQMASDHEFVLYNPAADRAVAVSNDDDQVLLFRFEVEQPKVRPVP